MITLHVLIYTCEGERKKRDTSSFGGGAGSSFTGFAFFFFFFRLPFLLACPEFISCDIHSTISITTNMYVQCIHNMYALLVTVDKTVVHYGHNCHTILPGRNGMMKCL